MNKLKSRKFWAAVAGVIFAGLAVRYPEHKDSIAWVSGLLAVYIGAEAHVDGKAAAQEPRSTVTAPLTPEGIERREDSE